MVSRKDSPMLAMAEVNRRRLARNSAMNLAGQAIPLVIGVACMPYIVRGLGTDRFGILGLVWVVFAYFSFFDLGLGRAITKFLAESVAANRTGDVPRLVWTALVLQGVLGIVAAGLMAGLGPILASRMLKVPSGLLQETRLTIWILAAVLPVMLVSNGFRATLEGCQRFDLINLLRVPGNVLIFLIPALAVPLGLKLPGIVLLIAISRLILVVAHFYVCEKVLLGLGRGFIFEARSIGPLLLFGGWVTVGNIINPILLYLDRFLIASAVSVALVGYYTAPFEAVTRLWMIPASLALTIFPACSALGTERTAELELLYSRSLKYIFLILAPIILVLVVFSRQIIALWLGAEFASKSSAVLEIIAVGVFVNCFAHVPYNFLQALGRPDIPSKVFLFELLPYGVFAWWLIHSYGINGAAAAWSVRVAVEVLVLLFMTWKLYALRPIVLEETGMLKGIAGFLGLCFFVAGTVLGAHGSLQVQVSACAVWIAGFALYAWKFAFDDSDRESFLAIVNPLLALFTNRTTA